MARNAFSNLFPSEQKYLSNVIKLKIEYSALSIQTTHGECDMPLRTAALTGDQATRRPATGHPKVVSLFSFVLSSFLHRSMQTENFREFIIITLIMWTTLSITWCGHNEIHSANATSAQHLIKSRVQNVCSRGCDWPIVLRHTKRSRNYLNSRDDTARTKHAKIGCQVRLFIWLNTRPTQQSCSLFVRRKKQRRELW